MISSCPSPFSGARASVSKQSGRSWTLRKRPPFPTGGLRGTTDEGDPWFCRGRNEASLAMAEEGGPNEASRRTSSSGVTRSERTDRAHPTDPRAVGHIALGYEEVSSKGPEFGRRSRGPPAPSAHAPSQASIPASSASLSDAGRERGPHSVSRRSAPSASMAPRIDAGPTVSPAWGMEWSPRSIASRKDRGVRLGSEPLLAAETDADHSVARAERRHLHGLSRELQVDAADHVDVRAADDAEPPLPLGEPLEVDVQVHLRQRLGVARHGHGRLPIRGSLTWPPAPPHLVEKCPGRSTRRSRALSSRSDMVVTAVPGPSPR
jgi:hypothetical protein